MAPTPPSEKQGETAGAAAAAAVEGDDNNNNTSGSSKKRKETPLSFRKAPVMKTPDSSMPVPPAGGEPPGPPQRPVTQAKSDGPPRVDELDTCPVIQECRSAEFLAANSPRVAPQTPVYIDSDGDIAHGFMIEDPLTGAMLDIHDGRSGDDGVVNGGRFMQSLLLIVFNTPGSRGSQSSEAARAHLLKFIEAGEAAKALEEDGRDMEAIRQYEYAINLSKDVSNADVEEVCFTFSRRVEELRRRIAAKNHTSVTNPTRPRMVIRAAGQRRRVGAAGSANGAPVKTGAVGGSMASHQSEIDSLIVSVTGVKWEDVVGLEEPKRHLMEMIIMPSLNPKLFTGLRAPPLGLLLFGPPGNGKTHLAKAVASQCKDVTFFSVSASALTSRWHGEDEKIVRDLFTVARARAPSVIFMDEVDSILGKRGDNDHEATRRLKTEMLIQLDGIHEESGKGRVVVLAATNRPMDLDEAVLRRFPKRIYVPLPEPSTRAAAIKKLVKDVPNSKITERDIQKIVATTEHYSHSDLNQLCREAAMSSMRNLNMDKMRTMKPEDLPPLRLEHFLEALKVIRPSSTGENIAALVEWNRQHGVV
ncbi:Katanin p60 ATPase-containing subunit A-like 2 [Perkinsus olseni]|uniref:Katanin p60 ATPase-containing subunit A-like 2 n=1 Tax=Perkinsus olseni TaxID=32597 RepID=A0A7J6LEW0_PEROL|nr:Katanin p60 ATPase-containing subunit A-like 2 [Perkinsus olseni]